MDQTPRTICDHLKKYAHLQPEKKLLGDAKGWLTVAETLEQVNTAAARLAALGLGPGEWAALRMSQNREAVVILLALQAIGAVAVLTDCHSKLRESLDAADLPLAPQWRITEESGQWILERGGARPKLKQTPSGDPDAPGFVIFTSGSTGKRKGVILSQNNLIANLLDSAPLGGYSEDDIALGALPLCHVFGLALLTGAIVLRHSLYITPGADLETVLRAIQDQRLTRMNGVPSLYLSMAAQRERFDLSSLRVGFIGGGPCTAEQFEKIERELGMTLVPVYGMSECIGISCASWQDPREVRMAGVGRFYPMNTGKILREDGMEAVTGETGEVCVKGPMRFLGYCRAEQTGEAVDGDGFLHTGDLGYLDEQGVLHLTGRKKDIIIRNGINLSPRKIEQAMLDIPGVRDAAVVGLRHPVQGEVPWAMAVTSRTEPELLALLSKGLCKNEIPVGICVVDRLPLTGSGKPDKVTIREVLASWAKASS